jgi:Cu(I)/Ag(I) efflux system periplasmic protein CusF
MLRNHCRSTAKRRVFSSTVLLAGFVSAVALTLNAHAQSMGNMAGMEKASKQNTASGSGTVVALNAANKKVTLDHGPMPAIHWPAMKMEFPAAPSVDLSKVKVGDRVKFTLTGSGNAYTVQSITPER